MRVPKTADLVAARLRRQIVRGDLAAGDSLPPETALIEQFEISRPTLREAFRVLESEGLNIIRRGAHGGARVQPPSPAVGARYAGLVLQYEGATVEDVLTARAFVETPAAGMLARNRTAEQIAELERLLVESDPFSKGEAPEKMHHQHVFHEAIPRLSGSKSLALMAQMLSEVILAAGVSYASAPTNPEEREAMWRASQRAHERLVELVRDRDAQGAEELWRSHLVAGGEVLVRDRPRTAVVDLID
jgi:DNA-binding FadR family transcriptional regulator